MPDARELLIESLNRPGFNGTIRANDATQIAQQSSQSIDATMVELLPLVARFAQPAISGFHVGALLRGVSGRLYFGVNIELPGQTLGATVHAEQCAAANAYHHGEEAVDTLAVTAAPCGLCRQFLWELCFGGDLRVLTPNQPPTFLTALLPQAFGPADLGLRKGALPVSRTPLRLNTEGVDSLAVAALNAASLSYSPYTKSPAGVALKTARGRIHSGSYIENAAFNPSLSPFQSALAMLTVSGDRPDQIERAVLIESNAGKVRHEPPTRADLHAAAPQAQLQVHTAF